MVKKQKSNKNSSKPPSKSRAQGPSAEEEEASKPSSPEGLKLQQRLLDLFSSTFNSILVSEDFPALLQEIKQALFNRDFGTAFGREEYLQAYAARWSPSRALCYAHVLNEVGDYFDEVVAASESVTGGVAGVSEVEDAASRQEGEDAPLTTSTKTYKMLSIGGCAAELIAFAAHIHKTSASSSLSCGAITLLDSAPWSSLITNLTQQATTPPHLSKYASAAAKASNHALVSKNQLSTAFVQQDALSLERDSLQMLVGKEPLLVTLLFTLNELYTNGGIGRTTRLLKALGEVLPERSLLLVVDSPGSYSEAAVGKEKKRYPMQWLLNHTLVDAVAPKDQEWQWERLESQDSIWFRLPEALSYPIPLEDMRYQMHLYRKQRIS